MTINDFAKLLRTKYPVIAKRRPLAIGTGTTLTNQYPDVPPKVIQRTLARHCSTVKYLTACAKGGPRYLLDGTQEGTVSAADQNHARTRLKGRAKGKTSAHPESAAPQNPQMLVVASANTGKIGRPILTLTRKA